MERGHAMSWAAWHLGPQSLEILLAMPYCRLVAVCGAASSFCSVTSSSETDSTKCAAVGLQKAENENLQRN